MKKMIIFGAGELGEVAGFYFTHDSEYEVAAFCLNEEYIKEDTFFGKPVVSFENLESEFPPSEYVFFAAVSYKGLNTLRRDRYLEAKAKGYTVISYVSSKAIVWPDLSIGENCFILENNNIQPFVHIGNNVTLWCSNHIGHHARIDDDNFFASHIVVSGGVHFKKSSFVGVNATFRDHITIGESCLVAAAANVMGDVPDRSICFAEKSKPRPLSDRIIQGL